ncbi:MAG: trigger factor [Spirochaetota bacterium]
MEYKLTKNDNATADLSITFTPEEIEEGFKKAYERAQKSLKVNGFRKGKAPIDMVRKVLGESVTDDALNIIINDSLLQLLPKLEHMPYNAPSVKIEKYERNDTLEAIASFEITPQVTLGSYTGHKLQVHKLKVKPEEIDSEIEEIRFNLAKIQLKEEEETSQDTDMVEAKVRTIPADLTEEEKAKEIPESSIQYYIGKKANPKGLDEHFMGLKTGEEKSFAYTYPEDHPGEQFRGKSFTFEVNVVAVNKVMYPEIDDDLAIEWNETETLQKLRENLENDITKYYEDSLHEMYSQDILNRVVEDSQFEIPESLLKTEGENVFKEMLYRQRIPQFTMEQYAEAVKDTLENVEKTFQEMGTRRIKNSLVLMKLTSEAKVEVSEEEVQAELEKAQQHAEQHQQDQKPDPKVIRENLTIQKIFRFLVDNAKKTKSNDITVDDAKKLLSKES